MFLTGKRALVTGSTSGIGLAVARSLHAEGAEVVLSGFGEPDAIAALCAELSARHVPGDLSQREGCEALMAGAGPIDILVNNAGMQHVAPIEEFPVDKWDMIIALNLTAAFHTSRLAVPHMKAAGWGRIINVASAHSVTASPFKSAYVWTPLVENQIPDTMKARGMTREEVIRDVLLVRQPTKRFVQPGDVGAMAAFLCREEAANITGANMNMDGGWTAE